MKRLLISALFASALFAQSTYLVPQGIWPLCQVGIQMPGCESNAPELYMLITDSAAEWKITATLISGETVERHGVGQTYSIDFGGIVLHWKIEFRGGRNENSR